MPSVNDWSVNWRASPALMAEHLTGGRFKRYAHTDFIDGRIAAAIARGNARLIVSVPPRHGKSWLISRFTPAWFLSLFPEKNVILASYEATFASSWGRLARNFIQEHEAELGIRLADDSQAMDRWHTRAGGGMITAGVGGAITGRGGDLLIVDDPVKNWEEADSATMRQKTIDWWGSTFYTRAEPGASILVLATRWHERDLSGYLMSDENETSRDWTEIKLPALAEDADPMGRVVGQALCPERYDEAAMDKIRKSVGSRAWNALYQQRPSAAAGNIIKREHFRHWDRLPDRMDEHLISLDATFTGKAKSDFVAMQYWGRCKADKYLIDQVYGRMGITDTIRALVEFSRKYPLAALKLIENKANGPAIEDILKHEVSGIVLWEPTGDKVARANAVAPQFESGNVYVPMPSRQPWVSDLIEEAVTFPNSAHDDRVDAMTMALLRLSASELHEVGTIRIVRR